MTDAQPARKRAYQKHGLTALDNALRELADRDWIDELGATGEALRA